MSEEMMEEDFLSDILEDLEDETKKSAGGGGKDDPNRPVTKYLPEGKFVMRVALDSFKKLFASAWVYNGKVEITDSEGKKVLKSVRALSPKDNDPLKAMASELGWQYKSKYTAVVFGEIISSEVKDNKYFTTGPCILVVNKKFLDALKGAIQYLSTRKAELARAALDPKKPGLPFVVEVERGTQGKVSITPDVLATEHVFKPETVEYFKDINNIYWIIPKPGSDNDAAVALLSESYQKALRDKMGYVDPNAGMTESSTKADAPAEKKDAVGDLLKEPPKAEPAATTQAPPSDVSSELDAALKASGL